MPKRYTSPYTLPSSINIHFPKKKIFPTAIQIKNIYIQRPSLNFLILYNSRPALRRYDTPEYEAPRSRSRYRSRFMRNRDGDDSDGGDPRSQAGVRFNAGQEPSALRDRERVLDTEDASRGPLSGIFRLTDSPRVMKKLNECERAGKRKKDEPPTSQQQQQAKPQVRELSSMQRVCTWVVLTFACFGLLALFFFYKPRMGM